MGAPAASIEPHEVGGRVSPRVWTAALLRSLPWELIEAGHPVSAPVVGGLLRGPGFSLPGMARPRPVQRGSRSRVGVVRSAE